MGRRIPARSICDAARAAQASEVEGDRIDMRAATYTRISIVKERQRFVPAVAGT
jgi:hypothetical protein